MRHWFELLSSGFSRQPTEDPLSGETSKGSLSSLKVLKPYLKKHYKLVLSGILIIFLVSLLAFPTPLVNRFLIDDVIMAKRLDLLVWVVAALVVIKIGSGATSMAQTYIFTKLQNDVSIDLQRNLLDHLLELPKAFFDEEETGYLMSRVSMDAQGITWFFSQTTVNIISNVLRLIGGAAFLFWLEWRLALISLLILPLLVLVIRVFSSRIHALSHRGMEQRANVNSRLQETLSSIPLIKAFTSEEKESQRVIEELENSQRITMEQNVAWSMISSVLSFVPDVARAVVLILGVIWIIQDEWTLGSLLAFQSYMGFVFGPAMFLANVNIELQNALAALERVTVLMGVVPEDKGGGVSVSHLQGAVKFSQVSFAYSEDEKVLEDVSFEVQPGEHIAIVGSSGVGKTTLISLLMRFYQPHSGEILYDGVPAAEYNLQELRQRLGYVAQSTQLLAGTLRETLCYGSPDGAEDELERVIQIAGLDEFIHGLPDGLDTIISEKGANLSEGQKQRLAIARALLKDPDILIMDEPSAALDSLVERSIFNNLPREVTGKTLFIAAHRISTIQRADRVLLLKDKHLVGFDTHDGLQKTNEYYRSLMNLG